MDQLSGRDARAFARLMNFFFSRYAKRQGGGRCSGLLILIVLVVLFCCYLIGSCSSPHRTVSRNVLLPTSTCTRLPTRVPTHTPTRHTAYGTPGTPTRTRTPTPVGTINWADLGYWELQERYDTLPADQWQGYAERLRGKRVSWRGWVLNIIYRTRSMTLVVDVPESKVGAVYVQVADDVYMGSYCRGQGVQAEGDISNITETDGYVIVSLDNSQATIVEKLSTPTSTPVPTGVATDVSYRELQEHHNTLSTDQWYTYSRKFYGKRVSWYGTVVNILDWGMLWIDVDPANESSVEVYAKVRTEPLPQYRLGQRVLVEGDINTFSRVQGALALHLRNCRVTDDRYIATRTGDWLDVTHAELQARYDFLSTGEWQAYRDTLIGRRVAWRGEVITTMYQVDWYCLELDLDPVDASHVADVTGHITVDHANLCQPGQRVRLEGEIGSVLIQSDRVYVSLYDCAVLENSTVESPMPTATFTATPTGAPDVLTHVELAVRRDALSHEEWTTYQETLIGKRVSWRGEVLILLDSLDGKDLTITALGAGKLLACIDLTNSAGQYVEGQEVQVEGDIYHIAESGGYTVVFLKRSTITITGVD